MQLGGAPEPGRGRGAAPLRKLEPGGCARAAPRPAGRRSGLGVMRAGLSGWSRGGSVAPSSRKRRRGRGGSGRWDVMTGFGREDWRLRSCQEHLQKKKKKSSSSTQSGSAWGGGQRGAGLRAGLSQQQTPAPLQPLSRGPQGSAQAQAFTPVGQHASSGFLEGEVGDTLLGTRSQSKPPRLSMHSKAKAESLQSWQVHLSCRLNP